MATGSGFIPPEVQALVNRARQLSRSIETNGAATADSIPQALTIIQDARTQLAALQSSSFVSQSSIDQALTSLDESQARLVAAQQEEATPQPQPPATASQTVQADGPQGPTKSPVQEVGTDGRVVAAPPVTPATNATPTPITATNAETNTDPTTVTLAQSQATTPQTLVGQPLKAPAVGASSEGTAGEAEAQAQLSVGRGAPGADAASTSPQATQAAVDAAYNTAVKIKPQDNVLDKFSSYTYTASVYLLTPPQYEKLLNSKDKKINGYQLLFQSGGAGNNVGGPQGASKPGGNGIIPDTTSPDAGRNPFFDHDFYIDSITIDNALPGKQTSAAHMVTDIKFTVIEPMGITLLDRLYDAVKDIAPKDGAGVVNYSAATYLMVIRFFGYDESGQLVSPGQPANSSTSNPKAVVEKFVPFLIKKINWGVGSKLVQYDFECAPIGQLIGSTTARGTIPYDIELTDSTVGGLLAGSAKYGTGTPAVKTPGTTGDFARADRAPPAKANSAPSSKKTITQGLMDAMNTFQQEQVKRNIYSIPDEYEIEFAPGAEAIKDATIVLSDKKKVDKPNTPMNGPPTVNGGVALDPARQAVDLAQRSMAITAGQQIVQAIELAIRNSSYVYNQSLLITSPDGALVTNSTARNTPMKWFLISMSAVPSEKIDPLRNDHAYKIKYTISSYDVPNFDSRYFPVTQFPGTHKQYNYWFTGQNNAVIDYQAQFNSFYNVTVSGSTPADSLAQKTREKYTSSMRDIPRYVYMARSTESGAGAPGKSNEISSNAAEYLYSPGDLHTAKIKIIGDPAWIQQGSLYRAITDKTFTGVDVTPGFLADGTIDFDSSQVLLELAWQRPEDYDLSTGLADPYAKTQKKYGERRPLQSNVYQVTKVTSEFRQGKFEQMLHGSLYFFPKPDGSNAVTGNAGAAVASTRPAQTTRPANQPNQTAATQLRTGVDLTNASAGGGRGDGQAQLLAERARLAGSSTSAGNPTSSLARGTQALLNPPTVLPDATDSQLRGTPEYNAARRSGQTDSSAIQAARTSFAATAGGSPVSSNGQAIATGTGTSPPTLPSVAPGQNTLSAAQRAEVNQRQIAAAEARLTQRAANNEQRLAASGTPVSSSAPRNQKIAKDY
jgi:hypothetical protein